MQKKYTLGQVLYIIPKDKKYVLPIRINKILETKSLSKDVCVAYQVQVSASDSEEKLVTLSSLENEGEVFESISEVRQVLLDRVICAIDKSLLMTKTKVKEWFNIDQSLIDDTKPEKSERQRKQKKNVVLAQEVEVQENLVQEIKQAYDAESILENIKNQTIELPDGTIAKIRSVSGI